MRDELLAPAEEPGLWTPPSPGERLVRADGFTVVVRRDRATVEGVRLGEGAVPGAVEAARALARGAGAVEIVWWAGELSRPAGLPAALAAAGLVPFAEEPLLLTLVIDHPPPATDVEVRRVTSPDDYRAALEVDMEAWGMPAADRAARRAGAAASFAAQEAGGRITHHLALVDGRPAGFGRMVLTGAAGVLMGGAVAPWARGRGAYRALVRARWDEAVARGAPRLVTSAGAMSAPILQELGFRRIGEVHLLRDPEL